MHPKRQCKVELGLRSKLEGALSFSKPPRPHRPDLQSRGRQRGRGQASGTLQVHLDETLPRAGIPNPLLLGVLRGIPKAP